MNGEICKIIKKSMCLLTAFVEVERPEVEAFFENNG
jgi:hypothetical protein